MPQGSRALHQGQGPGNQGHRDGAGTTQQPYEERYHSPAHRQHWLESTEVRSGRARHPSTYVRYGYGSCLRNARITDDVEQILDQPGSPSDNLF